MVGIKPPIPNYKTTSGQCARGAHPAGPVPIATSVIKPATVITTPSKARPAPLVPRELKALHQGQMPKTNVSFAPLSPISSTGCVQSTWKRVIKPFGVALGGRGATTANTRAPEELQTLATNTVSVVPARTVLASVPAKILITATPVNTIALVSTVRATGTAT